MEKSKVYIFTEGGGDSGFGHITRCTALYEEILSRGHDAEFIVCGTNLENSLTNINYQIIDWRDKTLLKTIIGPNIYAIIDSYKANKDVYEFISQNAKMSIYIDDNMRMDYPSGIVINPSLYGDTLPYRNLPEVEYLLGKDYIILRKEFSNIELSAKAPEIKNILITIGGSDPHNLTPRILKFLKSQKKCYNIKVVIGNGFDNLAGIKKEATNSAILVYNLDAAEMKKTIEESDFVISGCGQTIHELLALRTPFFPIVIANNQRGNAHILKKMGVTRTLANFNDTNLMDKIAKSLEGSFSYKENLDTNGASRIVSSLLSNCIIDSMRKEDIDTVYELSNKEYVRIASINTDKIKYKEHVEWFTKSLNDKQKSFYAIRGPKRQFLGQVRFSCKDDLTTVSLSFTDKLKGRRLGSQILRRAIDKFTKEHKQIHTIIAFIKEQNTISKKIFKRNGFKLQSINGSIGKYVKKIKEVDYE